MCFGATMAKRDGFWSERGEPLLHPPRLERVSYAEEVFNLSGSELVFLLVAGLVVLGPERLPGVIRKVGKTYADLRRATAGIEKEFRQTFDEPLKDLRSTVDQAKTGFGLVDTEPSPPMRPEQAVQPDDVTREKDTDTP
jgi:sec-independent protein translocase protein TatB